MKSNKQCLRCDQMIPDFARLWWKCPKCGFQQGIPGPSFGQLCARNAWALVLSGVFLGVIPYGLAQAKISIPVIFFLPSAATLVCGIIGFLKRGQTR